MKQIRGGSILIKTYEDSEGRKLRVLARSGTVWFAAKDVCDALGISDVSEVLRSLPTSDKISVSVSEGKKLIMISAMGLGLLACSPALRSFLGWAYGSGKFLLKQPRLISSAEEDEGYYTVSEYAACQGYMLCNAEASKLGAVAGRLSRERNIPIHRHAHELFGFVNAYAEEVIAEVFDAEAA